MPPTRFEATVVNGSSRTIAAMAKVTMKSASGRFDPPTDDVRPHPPTATRRRGPLNRVHERAHRVVGLGLTGPEAVGRIIRRAVAIPIAVPVGRRRDRVSASQDTELRTSEARLQHTEAAGEPIVAEAAAQPP